MKLQITKKKACEIIGWIAVFLAYALFTSFIDQIRLNLKGQPCSVWVPASLIINCGAWTSYALLKEKKDWQMFSANFAGVVIGIITFLTI